MNARVWRVAVPAPLRTFFDYLPPSVDARAGCRVRVPFGRGSRIGILIDPEATTALAPARLRRVAEVLDDEPALPTEMLGLLRWCAAYYHHPPGEVIVGALPGPARRGAPLEAEPEMALALTPAGRSGGDLPRAPRQQQLVAALRASPSGSLAVSKIGTRTGGDWYRAARALEARGWIERRPLLTPPAAEPEAAGAVRRRGPTLGPEQAAAAVRITGGSDRFSAFLLDGITGSGKTEVYFEAMAPLIEAGRQILMLVPEIGLTPQLIARARERFAGELALLHSGLGERERLLAWQRAASGDAPIVIGTRSAVFTPMPRLGMIIVDEEHDASYKQQETFRYHARDVAVVRAQRLGIPIVLGSATPSLETRHNSMAGRYERLVLRQRAGAAQLPALHLVDLRADRPVGGLSGRLADAIGAHLGRDAQVLLFLNRRGYAPTLFCEACRWVATCARCDARLILHQGTDHLRCHHCDARHTPPSVCPECAAPEPIPLGHGTERIEETLHERFPGVEIIRIDRDSTRRRGALEGVMDRIRAGRRQILVGTQMLAKGHHLPKVTLVGILDADPGLHGADLRAAERMGQTITQVAGRAGRAESPGEVIIQTRCPDHPLLEALVRGSHDTFTASLLEERRLAGMPPFAYLALIRAEATAPEAPMALLEAARRAVASGQAAEAEVLGPAPPLMARRAGRHRAQLLILATDRAARHRTLSTLVAALTTLETRHRARWTVDVDPLDDI